MFTINRGRVVYFFVLFMLSVFTFLPQSAPTYAQQDWQDFSADVDGDGLPNMVEESGWHNATGGPYVTDYLDADSDDDGLTDGQEKLYDTDPLDDHSPGIYAEYEDEYQTKQYYPWKRFGTKYIVLPYPLVSWGYDAVVVRRGTTFSVGGAADGEIEIIKSRSSLSSLSAMRNHCTGRWDITVPANGTVGIYTLRMRDGSWSEDLSLYVIFEIPGGLGEAFVNNYLYDDDPDNDRDESSIGYYEGADGSHVEYDHDDMYWIPPGQWITHGYTWRFRTQHYNDYVFREHVMPTINGRTNTWDAANALGRHVDEVTCFGNPRPLGTSWCVLNPAYCYPYGDNRNQCTNIANLLTAFNRAAGIPARPVFVDWRHATFDHSTEVWTRRSSGGSYDWYVMRGYTGGEGSCPEPYYTGGYNPLRSTRGWYSGGQGIYTGGENWNQGDLGGGSQNKDMFRQASWDRSKIVKKDWFETRFVDYFGWSSEPTVTGTPPGDWPAPPGSLAGLEITPTDESAVIQFGQVIDDYGIDSDGDGRFNQLVFAIQVNVFEEGDYWIRGTLSADSAESVGADSLAEAIGHIYLPAGLHTVEMAFNGIELSMKKVDGPYVLETLWATDVENPTKSDFAQRELAYAEPAYLSKPYTSSDFGITGATLSGEYNYDPVDTNGDGRDDALIVETGLNIEQTDTYTVQGFLVDGEDQLISQATWAGSDSGVVLQFEGVADTTGPYTLQHLHVRNSAGQATDGIVEPYLLGEIPELSATSIILGVQAAASDIGANFVMADGYADTRVDDDGDGRFDQLVIMATVEVEAGEGGQAYRLEGWLVDQYNSLVAWAISDPQVLDEGIHTLSLAFDGRIINEHGVDGPFTLIALKALPGDAYSVLNQVEVAYTTPAYNHDEFEEPVILPTITSVFEDDMENGPGQWTAGEVWSLDDRVWSSYNHAWEADASGTQSSSLTTASLDLSGYVDPTLKFRTCYAMETEEDKGYVEVSVNGGDWAPLATYGGHSGWFTEFVDLSGFSNEPAVSLRFKAASQDGLSWYIDDVYLYTHVTRFIYMPLILK
ncbi:MAG: hypothetical protein Kow0063_17000 [Anaerolineae bacterium]